VDISHWNNVLCRKKICVRLLEEDGHVELLLGIVTRSSSHQAPAPICSFARNTQPGNPPNLVTQQITLYSLFWVRNISLYDLLNFCFHILASVRGMQKQTYWVFEQCFPGCVINRLSACTRVPHRKGYSVGGQASFILTPRSKNNSVIVKFFRCFGRDENQTRDLWTKPQHAIH